MAERYYRRVKRWIPDRKCTVLKRRYIVVLVRGVNGNYHSDPYYWVETLHEIDSAVAADLDRELSAYIIDP